MNDFTFEGSTQPVPYETYEWDNTWIDHANNPDAGRILYIGDSISCATRRIASAVAEGKLLFDGFGTSKAVDNPYFKQSLDLFFAQIPECSAILFNNGLHGWHLSEEEYRTYYRDMVAYLKEKVKAPLFILLTTNDDIHPGTNDRVIIRNKYAREIAEEFELPIIDLYAIAVKYNDLHTQDKVHFTSEGYTKLAECILDSLKEHNIY